jgi:uncharacterized protein (DUF302 family)
LFRQRELHRAAGDFTDKHNGSIDMYYISETEKSFTEASAALEEAVVANGFSVLHIHNIGNTLRSKGVDFKEECQVFEVCNPQQASRVLANDMRLNMALPCRISVYTEAGKTHLGLIEPAKILAELSTDAQLSEVAEEVQNKTIAMIEAAK